MKFNNSGGRAATRVEMIANASFAGPPCIGTAAYMIDNTASTGLGAATST